MSGPFSELIPGISAEPLGTPGALADVLERERERERRGGGGGEGQAVFLSAQIQRSKLVSAESGVFWAACI